MPPQRPQRSGATVRALLIDDDPPARDALRELIAIVEWLELAGESAGGDDATRMIDGLEPELIFLDLRPPHLSGLEPLRRARHRPKVVFTAAFDRLAIGAFEAGALDYLLKPFGRQRLLATLHEIRHRIARRAAPDAAERARFVFSHPWRRLFARIEGGVVPIDVGRIRHIEALGDQIELDTEAGRHRVRMPLTEIESRLDPGRFQRVHRSHIVNLEAIERLRGYDDRRVAIELKGGDEVIASRAASDRIRRLVR